MSKEPSKDFRQLLEEQVFQLAGAASLCWEPKPDGVFDSTQAKKFADEAADNLLALCKEMLVQGISASGADENFNPIPQGEFDDGWNAYNDCLLKQLGEKI
jgi:hypothetical protein